MCYPRSAAWAILLLHLALVEAIAFCAVAVSNTPSALAFRCPVLGKSLNPSLSNCVCLVNSLYNRRATACCACACSKPLVILQASQWHGRLAWWGCESSYAVPTTPLHWQVKLAGGRVRLAWMCVYMYGDITLVDVLSSKLTTVPRGQHLSAQR